MKILLTTYFLVFTASLFAQRIEQQGFASSATLTENTNEGNPYLVRQRVNRLVSKMGSTQEGNKSTEPLIFIFPNPFTDYIRFTSISKTEGIIDFTVYNSLGKIISQSSVSQIKGEINNDLNLNYLPAGIYFIQLNFKSTDGLISTVSAKKLIKL